MKFWVHIVWLSWWVIIRVVFIFVSLHHMWAWFLPSHVSHLFDASSTLLSTLKFARVLTRLKNHPCNCTIYVLNKNWENDFCAWSLIFQKKGFADYFPVDLRWVICSFWKTQWLIRVYLSMQKLQSHSTQTQHNIVV